MFESQDPGLNISKPTYEDQEKRKIDVRAFCHGLHTGAAEQRQIESRLGRRGPCACVYFKAAALFLSSVMTTRSTKSPLRRPNRGPIL